MKNYSAIQQTKPNEQSISEIVDLCDVYEIMLLSYVAGNIFVAFDVHSPLVGVIIRKTQIPVQNH